MPIDFAPPQPNAQPFNIAPVQYTDPLQTLAQMGQLRTQAIQQQSAQMQLQQAQLAYNSNQAMMQAFAQGNGDWPATQKLLDSSPDILPSDRMAIEQHTLKVQQDWADLSEKQRALQQQNAQMYRANLNRAADKIDAGANPKDAIDEANLISANEGVSFIDPNAPVGAHTGVPQLPPTYTGDAAHVRGYGSSLILPPQIAEEEAKKATAAAERAKASESTSQSAKLDRERAISEVQAAVDQATGVPSPTDYTAIQKRYPNVSLPATPTSANIAQLVKSAVPVAEQPKTDIERMKANFMAQAQAGLQNGIHPIDSILPASVDPGANASYKSTYDLAMKIGGPDAAKSVADAAAAHRAAIAMKSNPSVIAGEAKTAAATAAATAPIKTGEAVATTLGTEKAKAGMLPAPWSTLDPQTGREALNKSIALDQKYTDTMAKAQNTLDTIGAALKGNQRAASFVTIEQLRSQLNRVTGTEIAATDAGGSLLRRLQNDISSKFQGRPFSETLKDSVALANLEKIAAENEYQGGQAALSNNYKIGPLPHATLPRGVSPAPGRGIPAGKVGVKLKSGNTATFDTQAQADKFRKDHPNLVQ